MAIKVALLGAGRMGAAVARLVAEEDDLELVAVFDVRDVGESVKGVEVTDISRLKEVLNKTKPDVAADFTSADACIENAEVVAAAGVNMVIGTTGFTEGQMSELKNALADVGAVISPNMSVGVNVFWQLIGEAAGRLKGYDIEVVEAHHRFKKDAPSGTAKKAVDVLRDATGKEKVVYGREGMAERSRGEIGVHSIRAGDIVGEHTVIYGTIGERVEVKHVAHSRDALAQGVIAAIRFVKGKKGIYDMGDVLGLK
jgi:4-hydroxy-tetrahydrodipicolinate reductase